uniref:Uncharacterized protein n=1 Tax=Cucumis melo TaxID=3656 RepID=A0A9I9EH86_CUCME
MTVPNRFRDTRPGLSINMVQKEVKLDDIMFTQEDTFNLCNKKQYKLSVQDTSKKTLVRGKFRERTKGRLCHTVIAFQKP